MSRSLMIAAWEALRRELDDVVAAG